MNRAFLAPWILFLSVLLAVGGCTSSAPQGRIVAEDDQVELLAGTWKGTFLNTSTNRSGVIELTLTFGSESSFGDVRLQVPEREEMYQLLDGEQFGGRRPVRPLELQLRYMKVSNGNVRGILEPYEDPGCRCTVVTTFEGVLRDGVIEGTFYTRGGGLRPTPTGSWNVVHVSNR